MRPGRHLVHVLQPHPVVAASITKALFVVVPQTVHKHGVVPASVMQRLK